MLTDTIKELLRNKMAKCSEIYVPNAVNDKNQARGKFRGSLNSIQMLGKN